MADRYFRRAMSSASDVPDQGLDRGPLPRTKPEPIDDPDDPEARSAEDEAVPVMMG